MTLYLDSALPADAQQAFASGLIGGITTNPKLLAQADLPAEELLPALCQHSQGTVFYQLTSATITEARQEAHRMLALAPGRIGLKIPCTFALLALATELAAQGHTIGMTAIFSPAQVYLACQAKVDYVLPYVNRSTRLLGDGPAIVQQMRTVIDRQNSATQIIAASIKSPQEAVDTLIAGAHHLTIPLPLIESLGEHQLSQAAIADFATATRTP